MSSFEIFALVVAWVLAGVLSALVLLAIRPLLMRYALARPNARSSHKVPTPQGGGIAVIAATLVVAAGAVALALPAALPSLAVLFGAAALMVVLGAIDDVRPIPVMPRLVLQAAAVGAVLFALPSGVQIVPALPRFASNDGDAECEAILAGVGFGQLPAYLADPHIAAGRLVPVLQELMPDPWDIYVYRPQRGPVPARIRLVFDSCVAAFGPAPLSI